MLARSRSGALFLLVACTAACGGDDDDGGDVPGPDGGIGADASVEEDVAARLAATLEQLASLGDKRAGSPGGMAAGQMILDRFTAAGLEDVRFEEFSFPAFTSTRAELTVSADGGEPAAVDRDVFYYSGAGEVDAVMVDLGTGHPDVYEGVDLTGKVCLVVRDPTFHRSSQYRECVAHGGAAMLYISQAPDNLIQVGTVTFTPEMGPIPALTIGADDGAALRDALEAGAELRAAISVEASLSSGVGRNVIGLLPGTDPSGAYILIGAHYDTWFSGSADNGTGAAALLELAEAMARREPPALGIVFVAYDGEEIGLFGGYDYLRDHIFVAGEPMLAFFNLEMPATGTDDQRALGHTNHAPLDGALQETGMNGLYPVYVGMEIVPALFGGVIPTDIQGMYWAGLAGFSTACDSPYYHTPGDTPDKIDVDFLASSVEAIERAVTELDGADAAVLRMRDPALWSVDVETAPSGGDLEVSVAVTDEKGAAAPAAAVTVFVEVDDFTRVHTAAAEAGADGRAVLTVPAATLSAGSGSRWLHVTAGESYPLAEHITALP